MMVKIKGLEVLFDPDDVQLLVDYSWGIQRNHKNGKYYIRGRKKKGSRKVMMHRVIMNAPKNSFVDHINGNTLDNRKCNLRFCTTTQNMWNRGNMKSNTSGYKGVSRYLNTKWKASITANNFRHHLGVFDCKHEAAKVYNKKAIELHGKFAKLNEVNFEA